MFSATERVSNMGDKRSRTSREGCCEVGGDWVPGPNSGLVAMVEADRMDCCGQPCAMLGEDAFWCMAAGWGAGAWGLGLCPVAYP